MQRCREPSTAKHRCPVGCNAQLALMQKHQMNRGCEDEAEENVF